VSDVIEIYVFTTIALIAAGVVIGAITVVSLGIRRDDRSGGFPADPKDRVTRSARRLTGTYIRRSELADWTSHSHTPLVGPAPVQPRWGSHDPKRSNGITRDHDVPRA
jgi:hypothetical protein